MRDSTKDASLRKRILMEVHRQSGGDMECKIDCCDLAREIGLSIADLILIAEQLVSKTWIRFPEKPLDKKLTAWKIIITMRGIEEAEKMERNWFQRFYEDHVVIWSLVLLVLGFAMSTASGVVINLSKTESPAPIINVPEQKPPIVNIFLPEQPKGKPDGK